MARFSHRRRLSRTRPTSKPTFSIDGFENLEARMMMYAADVLQKQHVVELLQQTVNRPAARGAVAKPGATGSSGTLNSAADAADIVWTNRGSTASDTDGFNARFGTSADLARGVVDAVILGYERMIGSFNYSLAGQTYSLALSMNGAGSGFGASASLSSSLGGKPKSGSISMGAGNNTVDPNDTNGWFMDPTPFDSSEFLGNIVNEFSGDAQGGSPAANKGDFFTVVAAEMTHCMGLFGSSLTMWASKTTNTNVADTSEGGGVGKFWVFNGPSIKHLLTSNNAGSGGQDFGSAVHSAGPGVNVSFGGDTYTGAQDQGNAVYEFGRRYMINNTFALMFKDAYGYSTVDPAKWGTTYSVLNETTKVVTVRGGAGTNNTISVTRSGNTISVSVNPQADVAGTGALPSTGDLPAFVTEYDISQVNTINITGSDGTDTITVAPNVGVPITVDGGTATDALSIQGTSGDDTIGVANGAITGASTITYSNVESLAIAGNDGNDTINFNGTGLSNVNVTGGNGNDTLNLSNVTNSSLTFDLGGDANTLTMNSGSYTINSDLGAVGTTTVNINGGALTFTATQHLAALNIANGASGSLQAGGTFAMVLGGLSIVGSGKFDLKDNDAIINYSGASSLDAMQALINSARSGGTWSGAGLTSTSAQSMNPKITTLGAIEGADYLSIYGGGATFAGQTVSNSSVLVKYTYYGDADFNGIVNFDDYSRADAGFGASRSGWLNGDFDGNGVVNFDDYSLIDLAFNAQGVTL